MVELLPIEPELPRIISALRERRNIIVVSPPGSGKTTCVPPAVLAAGLAGKGQIVVLEPRRIAARLAARRVASQMKVEVGDLVGYQVRYENRTGPKTRIRFVTEGVLTRQLLADPDLPGVSVVVIDEVHERHLQGDLALALLRRRQLRGDGALRLIAMSATIDAAPLAAYLDAAVLSSEGRTHPVDVSYDDYPDDRRLAQRVASAVRRLIADGLEGHVLVFLPGAAEIRWAAEACKEVVANAGVTLATLHGDLPAAEQDRAVAPSERRKVILATNVAESSITIDGVVAVIDSGVARVARYSPWSGVRSLRIEPISRASAAQRAGRAGRTRPGRCHRLYTRHDHDSRRENEVPEILRADLAELILALHGMGIATADEVAWLDPPTEATVASAENLLMALGATNPNGGLSGIGERMQRFPVHPRLARLLVAAEDAGVARDGAGVAALIAERPVRERAQARQAGVSGTSDLLEDLDRLDRACQGGLDHRSARANGLDGGAARAVDRARRQLVRRVNDRAPAPKSPARTDAALMRALLAAYPDRVARRRKPRSAELVFAAGGGATLSDQSVVIDAEFMVAVDAEERGRGAGRSIMVRRASAIESDWLLDDHIESIRDVDELVWNVDRLRVERVTRICYLDMVLDEDRSGSGGDPDAVAQLLSERARDAGVNAFFDAERLDGWRTRASFVAEHAAELGIEVPDDEALLSVLTGLCAGRSSFAELRDVDLISVLRHSMPADHARAIARMAPEHIAIPGRRRVAINYEVDRPPWIASRLQDFFGTDIGPTVAGGRVPLVLHLLAPNRRAVQVTSDLAGFWDRHYPALRRQLMRRYPKHAWPEDPRSASPPAPRGNRRRR